MRVDLTLGKGALTLFSDMGRASRESFMKLKLDRIISIATLVAAVAAIVLVLKKPASVSQPQPSTVVVERTAPDQTTNAAPVQSQPGQASTPSPVTNPASQATVQPTTAVPAPAA